MYTHLLGIPMYESPLATESKPVRAHKKRRNQTEAYHKRVQKKWIKRFGRKNVPCVFIIDNSVLGGIGKRLIVHPALMPALRKAFSAESVFDSNPFGV